MLGRGIEISELDNEVNNLWWESDVGEHHSEKILLIKQGLVFNILLREV